MIQPRFLAWFTAAVVAAGVFASSASADPPSYYPSGPQQNVPVDTVTGGGWTQCFMDAYGDGLHAQLPRLLPDCTESYLMLAGRPTGSGKLTLLAAAPSSDVLFDTGAWSSGWTPHTANGTEWYYHDGWSWGFAGPGDTVTLNKCDTTTGSSNDPNNRLCWNLGYYLSTSYGGYRLGSIGPGQPCPPCGYGSFLSNSTAYERIVYESNGGESDLTFPQPSDVAVDATTPAGATVTYNPVASDESGATVSCSPASGTPTLFKIGDTPVTCTATDADGDPNSAVTKTFTVHVRDAAEQLSNLATAVQGAGPGQTLANTVASAESLLAAKHVHGACGTLNNFIGVSTAQGLSTLAAAARRIEAVIPC